jgi:putative integral membrane protein (TIGR02587 family)
MFLYGRLLGGSNLIGDELKRDPKRQFMIDLARAFGGALIFYFPMLMTKEMWVLGFYINSVRLALFMFLAIPLLTGLSFYSGFTDTFRGRDNLLHTFIAYCVGFVASTVMLLLFAVIGPEMTVNEIIGKISIQAVPGSIGAMLAQHFLSGSARERENEQRKHTASYSGQLFLMVVGAIFLSSSLASTEEMVLIAYQMTDWHAVVLMLVTMTIMHTFVYAVEFRGQKKAIPPDSSFWSIFLRFTVVGYAIVLLISGYILWTFGRTEGIAAGELLQSIVVLGFPAALGASASRLIL